MYYCAYWVVLKFILKSDCKALEVNIKCAMRIPFKTQIEISTYIQYRTALYISVMNAFLTELWATFPYFVNSLHLAGPGTSHGI